LLGGKGDWKHWKWKLEHSGSWKLVEWENADMGLWRVAGGGSGSNSNFGNF
jgi:hypothetical protein